MATDTSPLLKTIPTRDLGRDIAKGCGIPALLPLAFERSVPAQGQLLRSLERVQVIRKLRSMSQLEDQVSI